MSDSDVSTAAKNTRCTSPTAGPNRGHHGRRQANAWHSDSPLTNAEGDLHVLNQGASRSL